jgi:hypothetical protein
VIFIFNPRISGIAMKTRISLTAFSAAGPSDPSDALRLAEAGLKDDKREAHSGFAGIFLGVCIGLAIWIALAIAVFLTR